MNKNARQVVSQGAMSLLDLLCLNLLSYKREEEEATEDWQRKVATVLFIIGKKGFLSLTRASIITVAWMASILLTGGDENLQSMACSILIPHLLESIDNGKDLEERVLTSLFNRA